MSQNSGRGETGALKKAQFPLQTLDKYLKGPKKKKRIPFQIYVLCLYVSCIKRTCNIPQEITEKTEKNLTKKKSKQGEEKKENKSFPSWAWFCFVCALFHNDKGAWVGGVGCGWLPLSACTSHLSPCQPSASSISTMLVRTDHFVWHYCHSITLMTRQQLYSVSFARMRCLRPCRATPKCEAAFFAAVVVVVVSVLAA